jgi:hypothetical protein
MPAHAPSPSKGAPRRRDVPTPRALVALPDLADADLLRFGGLDPEVRLGVQRELELLVSPLLPVLVELALAAGAFLLAPPLAWWAARHGTASTEALGLVGLFLSCAALFLGHAAQLAWIARWALGHRRPIWAFLGGVTLVAAPRVLGVLSGSALVGLLAALIVIVAYPMTRSLASGRYPLARLVACERRAGALDADPFVFDRRVLFGLGWALLPAVWLVRFLSRPFILPAPEAHRARMVWPERD